MKNFLDTLLSADSYSWRNISDSGNRSFHSLGVALDLLPRGWKQKNVYWAWRRDIDGDNWMRLPLERRWMPPQKVIEIFENLAEFYRSQGRQDLAELIITSRIPKAIFGNMNYFFVNGYDFDRVISKMKELDLLTKLSKYQGDSKFKSKIRLFLLSPKIYYKTWKKLKNSID